jgi:hypothetical protein
VQDQNVLGTEWDYLVVLDACRYDVFAEVYGEYLDGDLEGRTSVGSATPEWAAKTFTGDHDIAYFSTNPFINSLGIPLSEMDWGGSCDYDWSAADHITEVVDLWQEAWDDDVGSVLPGAVNDAVRERRDLIEATDRTVIHYMQPHAPFIRHGTGRKMSRIRKGFDEARAEDEAETEERSGPLSTVGDAVRPRVERVLRESGLAMKLGMWLELSPRSLLAVGQSGTRSAVEEYYEDNLRLVLEAVAELIEDLDGRVVVTSDHGEAFGEQGVWEHQIETHIPALLEVPWLVVEE